MVTLVRAPNPSAMTLSGTNSYLLDCGGGEALIIDPGPAIDRHIVALSEAAASRRLTIRAIAVTHGHPDHASGAPALAAATGAVIYMHFNLPLNGKWQVGQISLNVIDAPGHTFDHVIFYLPDERSLFTGDTILGEGTSVIAPPDGAMRPYQRTLARLADEFPDARTIYGGHGPIVTDARAKIAEYIEHRRMREAQILDALRDGPRTIPEIVRRVYGHERSVLWPAMARQILAHLIALEAEGRVKAELADRPMTDEETAMLNPRIEEIVGPAEAAVITAELGTEMRLETLFAYHLTGA
jgi:glyoxylase-like metal-dependent hydrolase (beta-lactamase superfamily II)